MVQEIVLGPNTNHYAISGYFDKHSRLIILVARQKLRQPSFFSVGSALKSIPIFQVDNISRMIVDYLQSLQYHGIFGDEWKKDAKDGIYKLLEVNARSCWYNTHVAACGVNHVLMAYREALGEETIPQTKYDVDVYGINLVYDLWSIKEKVIHGQLSYRDLFMSYMGKKDWLIYARDDPRPFLKRLRILAPM